MSEIRRLELTDRSIVEAYFRRYKPEISEFTFTNLFVWRVARPIFFAEVEGSMVFMVNTSQESSGAKIVFGHPLGENSPLAVANALDVAVAGFVRIPEKTANWLGEQGLHVEGDRDNWDYVYRVADLAELAGRHFHKKRNLVKNCLSEYTCRYESITAELIAECSDMQDRWCKARRCGRDPGLCSEYVAIRDTFAHFEDLELIGGAIRIDGMIQAYAVGEELRSGTAVCHFEKAMPGFRGLGQLINQWFAMNSLSGFEFENREQDLGIPGLRQAKESYYAHHMVEKYSAWFPSATSPMRSLIEPHECDKHTDH
jgi:hypothetical protein